MNGAESLVRTLVAGGVEVCFANPGTSEMHIVAALDHVDGIRPILGLFEGVLTGAADGYGRMAEKPAATLLHLGPGLANGLANLHNARRAATPVINIIGDHASYHAQYDALLASDVLGFARPVSAWLLSTPNARTVAADAARALQAARQSPGQIATLIFPADAAWSEAEGPASPLPVAGYSPVSSVAIDTVAHALKSGKRTALLLRGKSLQQQGLEIAGRIAAKTGARLLCDTFAPRLRRGAGVVPVERLPYHGELIVEFLTGFEQLILVGSKPPVSFFAYPDKPSWCVPQGCRILTLSHPHEDGVTALLAVAEAIGAPKEPSRRTQLVKPDAPLGALNPMTAGQIIARLLPANAIISDEASTATVGLGSLIESEPHDHLALAGGSIGQGIPLATGAAVACPNRKVVCLHGDGGAMYTLQALWTQAREKLNVTTVIFANHLYAILHIELSRVGVAHPGMKALSMLDLHNPELNWVKLANGMGVEASRAESVEQFAEQFGAAMKANGPRLIEVII